MTSTIQIRSWWNPACKANVANLTPAYKALDAMLKRHNYKPRAGVTGGFNCRHITGGTGYSLHAYDPDGIFTFWSGVRVTKALAVDINWDTNPYGPELVTDMSLAMILDIEKIKTKSGKAVWRWGGRYSGNKDAMHFEIIVSPSDLETGIVIPGVPTPEPTPDPEPEKKEDDMPAGFLVKLDSKRAEVLQVSSSREVHWVRSSTARKGYQIQNQLDGGNNEVCTLDEDNPDPNMKSIRAMVMNLPFIGRMPEGYVWKGPHIESD